MTGLKSEPLARAFIALAAIFLAGALGRYLGYITDGNSDWWGFLCALAALGGCIVHALERRKDS